MHFATVVAPAGRDPGPSSTPEQGSKNVKGARLSLPKHGKPRSSSATARRIIASVLAVAVTAPSQDRKNMALSEGCSSSTTHYDQVKGVCGWDGTYHDSGLHPGCGYQASWQDQPGLDTELSPQCCNLVAAAGAFDDYYWRYPVFDIKPQSL